MTVPPRFAPPFSTGRRCSPTDMAARASMMQCVAACVVSRCAQPPPLVRATGGVVSVGFSARTVVLARGRGSDALQRPYTVGGPPPPPLPILRLKAKILLRRLRCQEDLSFKNFGLPSAGDHRGSLGGGGSQPIPPPPFQTPPPPPLLMHPWGGEYVCAASVFSGDT